MYMIDLQTFAVLIIELIGTIAFSISGAMVGIRKKMDIFGVLVLGVVTAVGGGMMRDVILGKTPSAFTKPIYVEVAVISALVPFIMLYVNKRLVHSKYQPLYANIMFLMDSVGLGIFTAVGVSTGVAAGYKENIHIIHFPVLCDQEPWLSLCFWERCIRVCRINRFRQNHCSNKYR